MKLKSKALEVNLADYHVDVTIDNKYTILQEAMSKYYGLMEGLTIFLQELSHPYKNWRFIVTEARKYSLEYFHLLKKHSAGPEAAKLLLDILLQALAESKDDKVKQDSADYILLFIQKIINDSGTTFETFQPIVLDAFDRIHGLPDHFFTHFVRSYYGINRLAKAYSAIPTDNEGDYTILNQLLIKYLTYTYGYWLKEEDPKAGLKKKPKSRFAIANLTNYSVLSPTAS